MSKNLTENYPIVDTIEALEERLAGVREAQRIFAAYTQEQVDKIFTAAALAANKARIPLAKLAVEETGMGIVEDKVIKNHYASEYIYNAYRDTNNFFSKKPFQPLLLFFFIRCKFITGMSALSISFNYSLLHFISTI